LRAARNPRYGCLVMAASSTADLLQEGLALHRRGAVAEAAARYAKVLQAEPGNADAHYYLGMMACQQGRFAEGAECARRSLAGDARHVRAHVLMGRALQALSRHEEALASLERALALAPDFAQAHGHRADLLSELGRHGEAIESYDRALALAPDTVADWFNRGSALIAVGRYEDALASFDRVLTLKPDFDRADVLLPPRFLSQLRLCDWTNVKAEAAQLLTMIRERSTLSVPFAALMIAASPADQLACAARYVQDQPRFSPVWCGEIYSHDRIRVAYLSADLREHATAYLMAGLFERHDRSEFEITGLSLAADDNSPMRKRVRAACERFSDVHNRSDQDIADLIRRLEIDVLVDLMGFSMGNRINVLARRPAPVQVNYLGYPATTGAGYLDYILADETVIPRHECASYAEQVVWLPDTYQINDDRRAISEKVPTRAECGLPEAAFVFCCFNSNYKIAPDIFDIWMRLLRAAADSVLWLIETSATASANLRREAEKRGVSAQRLVFAPKIGLADHLARHRQADLFLDTLPCNAHTTASDALWAGLPVLTCLGDTFAGRVAASLLKAIGLEELVARSLEEYEALALKLASHPAQLRSLREKLVRNRIVRPLFDTGRLTRHIESAYHIMVDRYRRGEAPRSFKVEAA
jgi:protein O-GlcNAc transferase